ENQAPIANAAVASRYGARDSPPHGRGAHPIDVISAATRSRAAGSSPQYGTASGSPSNTGGSNVQTLAWHRWNALTTWAPGAASVIRRATEVAPSVTSIGPSAPCTTGFVQSITVRPARSPASPLTR